MVSRHFTLAWVKIGTKSKGQDRADFPHNSFFLVTRNNDKTFSQF